jgi:hypothetical protein
LTRETLRSAFREELDRGRAIASQAVANALFNNAVHSNNVAAQIWWSKARMRWSETLGHQMLDEHGKPTAPVIVRAAVLFEAALFLPHSTQARADVDRVT